MALSFGRRKRTKTAAEEPDAPPTPVADTAADAHGPTAAEQPDAPPTPVADTAASVHGPADAQPDSGAGQGSDAQQQLEQELAEVRETLQTRMDFVNAFTARESELKAREDAVLSREEALAISENSVRTREEAIAVQSAHLAAKETSLIERAKGLDTREASLNEREGQHAAKQAAQQELKHVQETVYSLVEQVADSVGDMDTPQAKMTEAMQADAPCAESIAVEEAMFGVEAANEPECEKDASPEAAPSDNTIAIVANIASSTNAADDIGEGQDLATVVFPTEPTEAVGDIGETKGLLHVEPACESGEESRTLEDAGEEDICDAIHSGEAVATESVEQKNLDQFDTTNSRDDDTTKLQSQIEQIEDADMVEMSSPAQSTSANAEHLVDESSDSKPFGNDATQNAEMPVLCSETEPKLELEQESAPPVEAQMDGSEDSMQAEDDSGANSLFTLDEFEAEMNRQRELDEAEERQEDANGNHRAIADADEQPR